MTENKRFVHKYDGMFHHLLDMSKKNFDTQKIQSIDECVNLLNELDEKWINEFSLRETLQLELQRVEEENKRLIKILDNVVNYMQKQYKEVPIDDFVEWWNKIAMEGLE